LWVGIDSDRLDPAEEQRRWADLIAGLGKQIEYAEINSVHGHDAFLLEYEQLNAIIREFFCRVEETAHE
jgi:homoserine O-acetyltransferase/O-succinyltransferase